VTSAAGELRRFKSGRTTEERRPNPTGQLDPGKPSSRVEVILAALIDNPEIPSRRRVVISEDPVDLVQLQ